MGHLTGQQLKQSIADALSQVEIGKLYFHYKHPEQMYKVTGVSIIEANDLASIKYVAMYEDLLDVEFVRPVDEFFSDVTLGDGSIVKRFQLATNQ